MSRHVTPGNILDPLDPTNCHGGLQLSLQQVQKVRYCVFPTDTEGKEDWLSDSYRGGPKCCAKIVYQRVKNRVFKNPENDCETPQQTRLLFFSKLVEIHSLARGHKQTIKNTHIFTHPTPSRRLFPDECHHRSKQGCCR